MPKGLCATDNENIYRTILQNLKDAASVSIQWKEGLQKLYCDWWSSARYIDLYHFSFACFQLFFSQNTWIRALQDSNRKNLAVSNEEDLCPFKPQAPEPSSSTKNVPDVDLELVMHFL